MKKIKKKTCFLVIVASIPFFIKAVNLTTTLGYNDPKTIFFYILSLIIFVPGVLCLLFFSENTASGETKKPTRKRIFISICLFICIFVSIQIIRHHDKINIPAIMNRSDPPDIEYHVNNIFHDRYEIVEIKSVKFKEVLVPNETDVGCTYLHFGEGIKKKAWEAVAVLKEIDGNTKQYSLYLSNDGVLIHSLPCGLVKEISQTNASNKSM